MQEADGLPLKYETRDDYIIWDNSDWDGDPETMKKMEGFWKETHEETGIRKTVNVFSEDHKFGFEMQKRIQSEWAEYAGDVVDEAAFVAPGLTSLMIESKLDVDVVFETFESTENALDWIEADAL